MKACYSRRYLVQYLASALLVAAAILPAGRPADAAKKFNPDSPKGTFIGTFTSETGQHTGNITIKVTADKRIRQVPNIATLAGTVQLTGGKAQKFEGTFIIPIRRVALSLKAPKGSSAQTNYQLDLSQDGTTVTGAYATNVGGNDAGSVTATRH